MRHRSTTPEFTWPVGTRPRCVEGPSEPGLGATNRGAHCRLVAFLSLGNALSPPFPAPSCPAQAAAGPPDLSLLSPLIWLNWGEESRAGGGRELRVACCRPEPLLCVSRCPIFSTCSEFPEAERSPYIPPFCMFFCSHSLSGALVLLNGDNPAPRLHSPAVCVQDPGAFELGRGGDGDAVRTRRPCDGVRVTFPDNCAGTMFLCVHARVHLCLGIASYTLTGKIQNEQSEKPEPRSTL